MKWRNASLRRRLLIWLLIPLLLISSLMLFEVRSNAVHSANQAFDRALLSSALAIADRVVLIGGQIEVDVPYVALEMLTSSAQDRVFYQVSTAQGEFITGYEELPPVPEKLMSAGCRPHLLEKRWCFRRRRSLFRQSSSSPHPKLSPLSPRA